MKLVGFFLLAPEGVVTVEVKIHLAHLHPTSFQVRELFCIIYISFASVKCSDTEIYVSLSYYKSILSCGNTAK